jgi:hypothetical protein
VALKPQDVLVALRTALQPSGVLFRFAEAAKALGLSRSEVHAAVGRCLAAKLMTRVPTRVDSAVSTNRTNLLEFLLHGARYAFPPELGGVTRGIPTGYAAPVLAEHFAAIDSLPPVWPHPTGAVRGRAFEPLYPSVPGAVATDPSLYAALALVDAIRGGSARDRELAARLLTELLGGGPPSIVLDRLRQLAASLV